MLTHLSLFSGIGGIDLASEWAGFTTVGQCEWADYPTKVLEKHWPNVPRWRDIRDVTADSVRAAGIGRIDLLSGGFPCQPHSVAGKREASNDDRDLWPELARVIGELKPRWFLGENVPGLLTSEAGRFFGRVLGDLATLGYRVGWIVYGAKDVGANHKRDRVFIVAYSGETGREERFVSAITEGMGFGSRMGDEELADAGKESNAQTCKTVGAVRNRLNTWDYVGRSSWRSEPRIPRAVSKSELGRMADGFSNGLDALGCLGNAVVPAQVYPILKAIAEIEQQNEVITCQHQPK
ncbi:DNA cytosine methyltransferase [Alicyclobacillus fastidiosus]|uniref:DNA (cytosine-5-)-methyltransferase n=1 Tax=Alicyclobacillus fastidiosus TaxID=392011 RepID=A0ABV5AK76_9BACL|nr:DNA (cytosine-5-)-methyltransferase [Alicyclobacillus fastidiosus]WEH09295.1 DNA (cytosine-5-)-methyltransferase [Alicyclobacillus fastidiosus]